ncbi:MAG TPA: hypothetical protein VIF10_15595 [Methylobacter sp.]|jgi:F0F1-type ATP synthase epsilon subunit
MDASKLQPRSDTFISPASSLRTNDLKSSESAIETRPDNDQDDSSNVSGGTVKLSDTSLKLSTSSPVKSSDRSAPIENKDQAQQALSQLIADIQNNPAQAQGAHSNIFDRAVKSLLG